MPKEQEPRQVIKRLVLEGWIQRKGKGDHANFTKAGYPVVTVDTGVKELPIGTYRNIAKKAGWL